MWDFFCVNPEEQKKCETMVSSWISDRVACTGVLARNLH